MRGTMHLLTRYSRSITPIRHGSFIQVKGMHNGFNRASIAEERYDNHNEIHRFAQALERGSSAGTQRSSTRFATRALPFGIMDDDVAQTSLTSCATHRIRATDARRVHWLWRTVLHLHILLLVVLRRSVSGPFSRSANRAKSHPSHAAQTKERACIRYRPSPHHEDRKFLVKTFTRLSGLSPGFPAWQV